MPPIRIAQEGGWTVFEGEMQLKVSPKYASGKLTREMCISDHIAKYVKPSDIVEITDDYLMVINGVTKFKLHEDKCTPLSPPQFEPYAIATLSKYQFDDLVEKMARIRPTWVMVSVDGGKIALEAARFEEKAEAAIPATVKAPLEPTYVEFKLFKAVKSVPLASRVEIAVGGEPVKIEATGEVKYKASTVLIRAIGDVEYVAWKI